VGPDSARTGGDKPPGWPDMNALKIAKNPVLVRYRGFLFTTLKLAACVTQQGYYVGNFFLAQFSTRLNSRFFAQKFVI
jgi:hypothetical protein